MIRFHLDENVDHAIAHGLRLRGLDVTTATDADLIAASDPDHIKFALAENRGIFTQDQDFLRRHQAGDEHAGIVYSPQGVRTIGEIVRYLHILFSVGKGEIQQFQVHREPNALASGDIAENPRLAPNATCFVSRRPRGILAVIPAQAGIQA